MNKQKFSDLIVSVESRKGGVGKTTASLCMAKCLLKKKYAVLVLDLDVTGTDAADIASAPFWKSDLFIVKELTKDANTKQSRLTPVNLIELFNKKYMSGEGFQGFESKEPSSSSCLSVDLTKVNVMGSQIYAIDDNDTETTCIEHPGILFDELHAFWLLELVKEIVEGFKRISNSSGYDKVAIILDNAPGYIGISPAIHEWLTDCGPSVSKFLIVSSLDSQDLIACDRTANSIHNLYMDKWRASMLYNEIANAKEGDGVSIVEKQKSFFTRLATLSEEDISSLLFYRNSLIEYHEQIDNDEQLQKNEMIRLKIGETFYKTPGKYIAAIINRVPRAIKRGHLTYSLSKLFTEGESIFLSLIGDDSKNYPSCKRMVAFDEYIEKQFLLRRLEHSRRKSERHIHNILNSLIMAEKALFKSASFQDIDNNSIKMWKAKIAKANSVLSDSFASLENNGFGYLTDLIHTEWLPDDIIRRFREAISILLYDTEYSDIERLSIEYDPEVDNSEDSGFIKDFSKHILKEMKYHRTMSHVKNYEAVAKEFANSLSVLFSLAMPFIQHNHAFINKIDGLFTAIVSIELTHWVKCSEVSVNRSNVSYFLAREEVTDEDIEREVLKRNLFLQHYQMRERFHRFADFYKACTLAQARIIDIDKDVQFVLNLLYLMVEVNISEGVLFPYVEEIAENVIINKSVSHKEAPNRMVKAIQTSEYFKEFDNVISDVLGQWGVPYDKV